MEIWTWVVDIEELFARHLWLETRAEAGVDLEWQDVGDWVRREHLCHAHDIVELTTRGEDIPRVVA